MPKSASPTKYKGLIWDWIRRKSSEIRDLEERGFRPDISRDQAVMQWILQDLGNDTDEQTQAVFDAIAARRTKLATSVDNRAEAS